MGEEVKTFRKEATKRWHEKMPRFFYWIVIVAVFVGGLALTVNTAIVTAGGTPHEWWSDIYPYIIGASAGAVFVCKFTVAGGFRNVDPDKITGHTILDKDDN